MGQKSMAAVAISGKEDTKEGAISKPEVISPLLFANRDPALTWLHAHLIILQFNREAAALAPCVPRDC